MSLTKFCCCCDLRRGCIVFTWLQLMFIALAIAAMSIPLYVLGYPYRHNPNDEYYYSYYAARDQAIAAYSGFSMFIAQQTIKAITCIALIWGLVKKQHLYYQAWMFVSGMENCVLSLSFLGCFFGGFALPYLFIPMILLGVIVGLSWYFWFSVYAVYQRDMKTTNVAFSENYERINLIMNNATPTAEEA